MVLQKLTVFNERRITILILDKNCRRLHGPQVGEEGINDCETVALLAKQAMALGSVIL